MKERDTIDSQIRAQNLNFVFQEGEWGVVQDNSPVPPWISHYCSSWETAEGEVIPRTKSRWNYSFSTPYALKYFNMDVLYCCCKCRVKAPDNVITVFELYR